MAELTNESEPTLAAPIEPSLKRSNAPLPEVASEAVRRRCDPTTLPFSTTAELDDLSEPFGQDRAITAARFAISVDRPGYNLFVLGPSGAGKHATIGALLAGQAGERPTPPDWVYVENFAKPEEPRVLQLPSGTARKLASDVEKVIDDLRIAVPAAFETSEYGARIEQIQQELKTKEEAIFESIAAVGRERGVAMVRSPAGVLFAPTKHGDVITPEEFEQQPEEEKERLRAAVRKLQDELRERLKQLPQLHKNARDKVRELDRDVTRYVVTHAFEDVLSRYSDVPCVHEHLQALASEIIEHAADFRKEEGEKALLELTARRPFQRYSINVLVDNGELRGAPVVYEDHPSYEHLVGRIEHYSQFGSLLTDFTLVKAGALHRANGGYLLIDAMKILGPPYAWEGLKRALFARNIRIETLAHLLGLSSTESLRPEPVPLDVKIVLFGSRELYYLLSQLDSEFPELFKVEADFEDSVERSAENERLFCRMVASVTRREGLIPFDRGAMARLIEEASRMAEDSRRLSVSSRGILDLAREAEHYAKERGAAATTESDVSRAVSEQARRRDRVRERMQEAVVRGMVLMDVSGERVGQVNGLAAMKLGDFVFGRPIRITATARIGDGKVVDIEREVELGGPLHSKGILILSNYLASHYAKTYPLSLSASLVFEQSYSSVEGDSASLAELCALISVLADVAAKQSIALTGSVNQLGQVQAIGAVNEKVEGFYDTCRAFGLTGRQGVIVPLANVQNLMLRNDVCDAISNGEFHLYAVESVDQAMEILTGIEAGTADGAGAFPEGSLNQRVETQLMGYAVVSKSFGEIVKLEERGNGAGAPVLGEVASPAPRIR